MLDAINEQVNAELYSAYLYLSMNAYFQNKNLPGFANWMMIQTGEEMAHAMKQYNYINDRGAKALLKQIAAPPAEWKNPLDVFNNVYEHEKKVTALINNLMDIAIKEKDHASQIFLQWFVTEQIEEEKNAGEIVEKLKLIGSDTTAIYILDKELALRAPAPPQGGPA